MTDAPLVHIGGKVVGTDLAPHQDKAHVGRTAHHLAHIHGHGVVALVGIGDGIVTNLDARRHLKRRTRSHDAQVEAGARHERLKDRAGLVGVGDQAQVHILGLGVFQIGLAGAAFATVTSECIGGLFPILYFARKNSSLLKLGRTHFNGKIFLCACGNGSSELMTNLSSSIVNSLYNIQLMNLAGENGVAAFGTIMYVNFIFIAIFLGYSIGSAPLVSYHYGAGNHDELKNLFGKSLRLIGIWGLMLFILAQLIARPLAAIFVGYDADLFSMTQNGFRIYCIAYLINGFNIYGSSFFTALNNGLISAAISFLRTLVFQLAAVLLLPLLLGINGIWSAVAVAELLTLGLTVTFFVRNRKKYHYA